MLNKTQVSNIAFEVPVYKLKVFSGAKIFLGSTAITIVTELYGVVRIDGDNRAFDTRLCRCIVPGLCGRKIEEILTAKKW